MKRARRPSNMSKSHGFVAKCRVQANDTDASHNNSQVFVKMVHIPIKRWHKTRASDDGFSVVKRRSRDRDEKISSPLERLLIFSII